MTAEAPRTDTSPSRPVRRQTAGEMMRPPATTVEPQAHLAAAAYLMKRSGDSALVVTTADEERRPIAIITDTDISQAVADGRNLETTRISDLSTTQPLTVDRDASAEDAIRLMLANGIHHIPVVDGGRLIGIVDMAGVCRAVLGPDESGAAASYG